MSIKKIIEQKIQQGVTDAKIEVRDESHLHEGHAGSHPDGESHFALLVVSDSFDGLRSVERQKIIYKILNEELKERVHALRFLGLHTTNEFEN